jgi:hypothetical protein
MIKSFLLSFLVCFTTLPLPAQIAQQVVSIQTATVSGGATWTLVQHAYNFTCSFGGAPSCAVNTSLANTPGTSKPTVADTAGNLVVVLFVNYMNNTSNTYGAASVSGETMTECSGFPQKYIDQITIFIDCWYRLSAAGGNSTFTYSIGSVIGAITNYSDVWFGEYKRSTGTATFDASGSATSDSGSPVTAPSVSISGTSDICLQWMGGEGYPSAISGAYTNPGDFDTNNQEGGFAGALNVTSYTAPSWTISPSSNTNVQMGAVCWK